MATDLGRKFKKITRRCEMCRLKYDAEFEVDDSTHGLILDDNILTLSIKKEDNVKYISKFMCPECMEKLLELLDKHFPRLNLEDEL